MLILYQCICMTHKLQGYLTVLPSHWAGQLQGWQKRFFFKKKILPEIAKGPVQGTILPWPMNSASHMKEDVKETETTGDVL